MPVRAATFYATSSTLSRLFDTAGSGDRIVLSGNFGATVLDNRVFARPLVIDASKAAFGGQLVIRNVSGLSVVGGRYGSTNAPWEISSAILATDSSRILFNRPVIIGDAGGRGSGIGFRSVDDAKVNGGSFTGLKRAIGARGVTNGLFTNNKVTRSTSEGFDIVSSHGVIASGNVCVGTVPFAGAHPDCIQLWSIAGEPVQSDIKLINNKAYGATQGFTSFDPAAGGGLRITISGNYINTNYVNGIACYGCVDSIFTDNILVTAPGASSRTRILIVGGSNNIISGNVLGAFPPLANAQALSTSAIAAAVPEPLVWLQLIAGFGLTGAIARRQRVGAGFASRG